MAAQPPNRRNAAVGRPSLAAERRGQVLSAFVDLIAERGLEGVTLDDVAAAANVQRSVIRHYVGNRTDLIRGAVEMLTDRYESLIRARLGASPTVDTALQDLFSFEWARSMQTEDRALSVLMQEAVRDDVTRDRIKAMYQLLIDEIAAAIRIEAAAVSAPKAKQAAYQIVCLAEHNATMQALGFPPDQSRASFRLARRIVSDLTDAAM